MATVHRQIPRGRGEPTTHTPVFEMVFHDSVHPRRPYDGRPVPMGVACRVIRTSSKGGSDSEANLAKFVVCGDGRLVLAGGMLGLGEY